MRWLPASTASLLHGTRRQSCTLAAGFLQPNLTFSVGARYFMNELAWAASWLYNATKDALYLKDAQVWFWSHLCRLPARSGLRVWSGTLLILTAPTKEQAG